MLTLYVLEINAEERERLVGWLQSHIAEDIPDIEYAPSLDIRPISIEELKFAKTPQVAVLGPSLLEQELTWISKVSQMIPGVPLIGITSVAIESLSHIEQMARLGITDTVSISSKPQEFLKKLVLLNSQEREEKAGSLIVVDSGKGGVGVTTIAASLAEISASSGKKTVLVDFDMETQDLTRFLQVRPFVNENLQLILEEGKPVSGDFIDQCINRIWEDEENLYHMAPPPEFDAIYMSDQKVLRRLLSVFEALDSKFDIIVVDMGSLRGVVKETLYRISDHITFVLNRDPAALYPSVDRLRKLQDSLSVQTKLHVIDNGGSGGLPRSVLLREFSRAAKLENENWSPKGIPHCLSGAKWPGSRSSFVNLVRATGRMALYQLAEKLNLVDVNRSVLSSTIPVMLPTLTDIYGAVSSKLWIKGNQRGVTSLNTIKKKEIATDFNKDQLTNHQIDNREIKMLPDLMDFVSSSENEDPRSNEMSSRKIEKDYVGNGSTRESTLNTFDPKDLDIKNGEIRHSEQDYDLLTKPTVQ